METGDWTQVLLLRDVAAAMGLGALIGLERESSRKAAGMRTHMFLAGSAALLVSLGSVLVERFSSETASQLVRSDPIRIIEAVITAIGFLGAGTIIRNTRGRMIEGVTTAASLLFTGGVGICCALSQWIAAVGVVVLALVTLRVLGGLEPASIGAGPDNSKRP